MKRLWRSVARHISRFALGGRVPLMGLTTTLGLIPAFAALIRRAHRYLNAAREGHAAAVAGWVLGCADG
jgi:hypothetical protein